MIRLPTIHLTFRKLNSNRTVKVISNIPEIFHAALLRTGFMVALLFILTGIVVGQQSTDNSYFLSATNRLKFGNFLFERKDYLRAAEEFKNALRNIDNDTLRYKYSMSLYKIGKFDEASDNFRILFFDPVFNDKSRMMFYEANFFGRDYQNFRELTDRTVYLSSKYKKEIERLKYISYFFDKAPLPDPNPFINSFDDSVQTRISSFYYQKKLMKTKSPTTAAIFSCLIPGLGKIYTGEIGDGITAFLSTAVCAYLAAKNFKDDHKFGGWLFTGLTAFFYSGNIYGSAASAQVYNARIRFDFEKEVKLYFEQRNYFLPRLEY